MKKRRKARELAMQALYALEISQNSWDVVLDSISKMEEDEEIVSFAVKLFKAVVIHVEFVDKEVMSVVENWDFERIALIDRLILRLALSELLYFEEIPPKVTINEAIDLAKKFSTAQSGRFVNGILDSLYHKYKDGKELVKRGRGLLIESAPGRGTHRVRK